MTAHIAESVPNLRPLTPSDLEAVVSIDYRRSGSRRRDFYERRMNAVILKPKDFIYLGYCQDDTLVGFAFARLVGGEFGREDQAAALGQLRFFRRAGFRHAPRIVLERDVSVFNE